MRIRNIGSNQTQLELSNGTHILFSYETPVAAFIPGKGYVRSSKKYSVTTSKHVNAWAGKDASPVPQSEIDALMAD
jgi:hypothetical protein